MSVTASYLTFVLDQLSGLAGVSSRRMFGGIGLYCEGAFFGLIDDDVVYFRVDDTTRPEFVQRGSRPFVPVASKPDLVSNSYFQLPDEILDDPDLLATWAKRATAVARAKAKAKKPAARKKSSRRS